MYRLRGDGFAGDVVPAGGAASGDVKERFDVDGLENEVVSDLDHEWKRDPSAPPADRPDGDYALDHEDEADAEPEPDELETVGREQGDQQQKQVGVQRDCPVADPDLLQPVAKRGTGEAVRSDVLQCAPLPTHPL